MEKVSNSVNKLLRHAYIADTQAAFFKECKENLQDTECIVNCDFSENYQFVFQDSIQGVHWNNDQATIHPIILYLKENNTLKNFNFVAISNIRNHDAIAWRVFQERIMEYIKQNFRFIKKVKYFSDGAVTQYKNKKNFINLSHHELDFGIKSEWHFFATSHGKGACDGIGGTVKRLARRYCLQHPQTIIKTAEELYNWADENIKNISFMYFESTLYIKTLTKIEERLSVAVPIKGSQSYHSFIPLDEKRIIVKETSTSTSHKVVEVMKTVN